VWTSSIGGLTNVPHTSKPLINSALRDIAKRAEESRDVNGRGTNHRDVTQSFETKTKIGTARWVAVLQFSGAVSSRWTATRARNPSTRIREAKCN
jgi:hypothetical protein